MYYSTGVKIVHYTNLRYQESKALPEKCTFYTVFYVRWKGVGWGKNCTEVNGSITFSQILRPISGFRWIAKLPSQFHPNNYVSKYKCRTYLYFSTVSLFLSMILQWPRRFTYNTDHSPPVASNESIQTKTCTVPSKRCNKKQSIEFASLLLFYLSSGEQHIASLWRALGFQKGWRIGRVI